jgi:ABC-type transport system involved in cytochrome bd biosynthesis fused ATPase/permease subunit
VRSWPILNFTRLVLLAVWFGAALFFSAVVAPAAFGVLRSYGLSNASEIAGAIVTRSLSVVNVAGFVVALLLLVTLFLRRGSAGRGSVIAEAICLGLIALGTGVGHWVIAARMRAIRAALELPIDQIAADDSRRIAFNSLHGYSVNALSLAMIAALVALVLMARGARQ